MNDLHKADILYNRFLSEGDSTAYDELMLYLGDGLVYYLNGYLHNWQDAEDLMIEAFARIMVKRPHIREGNFKAYLYKTARNLASRFHDRKSRQGEFLVEELPEEQTCEEKGNADNAEGHILRDERKKLLHMCLGRIDPDLREAIWLIYFEEMTYKQAADVLGAKPKRVEYLLVKGKGQLLKELEKEGITDAN